MPSARRMVDNLAQSALAEHGASVSVSILGTQVRATTYAESTDVVCDWAVQGEARCVFVANVHMVMEAVDDARFCDMVNSADLVTPDGMPLVWLLRRRGISDATRVYGPTLTVHVCEAAAVAGVPVGFYGGSPRANEGIVSAMKARFPDLKVAYAVSPPFRPLSDDEDGRVVDEIRRSGARILFVGLGCPKQEKWMAAHRSRLPLVQIGVGAAFALHAGEIRQAPAWIQRLGMEWAFRLIMEPKRLWRRYLMGNVRFVWLILKNWWRVRGVMIR